MNTLQARYGGAGEIVIVVLIGAGIATVIILARIRRRSEDDWQRALRALRQFVLPLGIIAVLSLLRECR